MLLIVLIEGAISITLNCEFIYGSYSYVDTYYTCVAKNLTIDSPDDREITEITGTYLSGKGFEDVEHFRVANQTIEYLPQNLSNFFPNIKAVYLWNTQLKEIHQDDFKPFGKKLEIILIYSNLIEYLEENVFAYNKNLRYVYLDSNRIKFIHENVFDNLKKLKTLWVHGNDCTIGDDVMYTDNNRDEVLRIVLKIREKCSGKYEDYAESIGLHKITAGYNVEILDDDDDVINNKDSDDDNSMNEKLDKLIADVQELKEIYVNEKSELIEEIKKMRCGNEIEDTKLTEKINELKKSNNFMKTKIEGLKSEVEGLRKQLN